MVTLEEIKQLQNDVRKVAELKRAREREESERNRKLEEERANESVKPFILRISTAIREVVVAGKNSIDILVGQGYSGKVVAHLLRERFETEGFSARVDEVYHPEERGRYDAPSWDSYWEYRIIISWK